TGSVAVTFSTSALAGANPGDFAIVSDNCAGASVAVGSSCQVAVAFSPTAVGARSALLQINDSASGSPQVVALSGIGSSFAVSPTAIAFQTQAQGTTSAPAGVTVTNATPSAITVGSIAFGGANAGDFALSSDGCSGLLLPPQSACTLAVTFTPQGL